MNQERRQPGGLMSVLDTTHVVIVGGGFAGMACAKRLANADDIQVTLLDRTGQHQFQPLLYQVATAELTTRDVLFDLDHMFRHADNVDVRTAEVVGCDPHAHSVTLADGETIEGDVLVLAAGTQPNFFHTPGASDFAFPLYSADDAQRLRAQLLQLFHDTVAKPELVDDGALTFVIVGAGPTGVETAGALSDLVNDVIPHRYPHAAAGAAKVVLVHLGPSALADFSDGAHTYATSQLQRRGVELRFGVSAKEITAHHIALSDGTTIPTHLVVWAGGATASPLAERSGISQGRGGRLDVRPDLTVGGFARVYALGDFANIPCGDESALPQLGSVATQSGAWAAKNIIADLDYSGRRSFEYHDKGFMAMIGRKAAVAEIGQHHHEMHGRIAFAAWLGVHAQLLADAGAEVNAFMSWAEEFYIRPHHRSAELLDPATVDQPRIRWGG
jgi:NADH dehydrogenase